MPARKPRGSEDQKADQVERVLKDAEGTVDAPDGPVEPDIAPDRTRFSRLNFSRMKLAWNPSEMVLMQQIGLMADRALKDAFPDVYWFLDTELYPLVREPAVNEAGEQARSPLGLLEWQRDEHGHYIERWARITDGDRRQLLHVITVSLIAWRQQRDMMWSSAMFAKGQWEEVYARGYIEPEGSKLTIDDRTNMARSSSMDQRYFAIFESVLSRRADSLVKSMERIEEMLLKTVGS
jgi:hypothetical protein